MRGGGKEALLYLLTHTDAVMTVKVGGTPSNSTVLNMNVFNECKFT